MRIDDLHGDDGGPSETPGHGLYEQGKLAWQAWQILKLLKGVKPMTPAQINIVTNIVAGLLAILEPVKTYLANQPFDWYTFALCIGGAIVAWFTGKSTLAVQK